MHDCFFLLVATARKVYNEEVVIFRSKPGASVGAHCGSSNAVINLHLTLKGGATCGAKRSGLQSLFRRLMFQGVGCMHWLAKKCYVQNEFNRQYVDVLAKHTRINK